MFLRLTSPRLRPTRPILSLLALGALLMTVGPSLAAEPPTPPAPLKPLPRWDDAPFQASPKELLKLAGEVPPGKAPVVVLLEEGTIRYDAQGRATFRRRMVYHLRKEEALDAWGMVELGYLPWYQDPPKIKARVISEDRQEHWLDQTTLDDAPAQDPEQDMYTDARLLRGPLPAIRTGVVVEEESVVQDFAPFSAGGSGGTFLFGYGAPAYKTRLVLEAPESLPLRYRVRNLPDVKVTEEKTAGLVRYTFEAGPQEHRWQYIPALPASVDLLHGVSFSTGASWQAAAKAWQALAEPQVAASDVRALAAETAGNATDRLEVARRLLAKVHLEARYTGLEFGQAAIVPRTPAETLKRRYGDCKDKSTLLVALLRARGIPAELALLRVASRQDVDPALPGLDTFNHVIVHLPGTPELWIDPTDELSPVGELPVPDQGRLALVISPETTQLVRTPVAPATANTSTHTREFRLASRGPGTVLESTLATGVQAHQGRAGLPEDRKELNKRLERAARQSYDAQTIARIEVSQPKAVDEPFRVLVESQGARRLDSKTAGTVLEIETASLFDRLPTWLLNPPRAAAANSVAAAPEEEEETDAPNPADPPPADLQQRQYDIELDYPFVEEQRLRFVLPEGLSVVQLPEPRQLQQGRIRFSQEVISHSPSLVEIVRRLEVQDRIISLAEARALQPALGKLLENRTLMIRIQSNTWSMLEKGDYAGAVSSLQTQAAARPKDASLLASLADVYLELGLGEAAREATARAVSLDPKAALVWTTRARVLGADLLGRPGEPGTDWAGAEAAWRKAVDLEPRVAAHRLGLVEVLVKGAEGSVSTRMGRQKEACEQLRFAAEELDVADLGPQRCTCLLQTQQYSELRRVARADNRGQLFQFYLAADFLEQGLPGLSEPLGRLASDPSRASGLMSGMALLSVAAGNPSRALEAIQEAARLQPASSDVAGMSRAIGRLATLDLEKLPPNDPHSVVLKLLGLSFQGADPAQVEALLAQRAPYEKGELRSMDRWVRRYRSEVPFMGDTEYQYLMMASIEMQSDGKPALGYRVKVLERSKGKESAPPAYVVPEGPGYKILALAPLAEAFGLEALSRVAAGDLEGANQWLTWAREDLNSGDADDPLGAIPFLRLWKSGAALEAQALKLGAASLLVNSPQATQALPMLLEARGAATSNQTRLWLDVALARAYLRTKAYEEALTVVRRLAAEEPDSSFVFGVELQALAGLKREAELRALVAARGKRFPSDPDTLRALARSLTLMGLLEDSRKVRQEISSLPKANASDFNELAWGALFPPASLEESLSAAEKAVKLEPRNDSYIHTLATVLAEKGQLRQARAQLESRVALAGGVATSDDWYVVGRIAEQVGAKEAAVSAYRRALEDSRGDYPLATAQLARARLKGMGVAEKPEVASGKRQQTKEKAGSQGKR